MRIGGDGIHELLDWTPYDEKVEEFKRENIHQSIIDTEINEMSYPNVYVLSQSSNHLYHNLMQGRPSALLEL